VPELPFPPAWSLTELFRESASRPTVSDDPVEPRESDQPPFPLDAEQLAIWNGERATDRSNGLVSIAIMLGKVGVTDVEEMASMLAERDYALGWNKYTAREDRGMRYREIVVMYGRPPLQAHLSGNRSATVPPIGMGTGNSSRENFQTPLRGFDSIDPIIWRNHRDTLALKPPKIDWLIESLLGRGLITELVAKVKMGKTTFALQGLRAGIGGDDEYCSKAVSGPIRVGYVTEEGQQTFLEALHRYGLADLVDQDAFFSVFDFETQDVALSKVVDSLIQHGQDDRVDVIVLDTLSVIAGLDEEDHSGQAAKVMHQVRRLAVAGFAVLILRHSRKTGGEVGDAGRGSSAISGYVDILLQIEPLRADDESGNVRVLKSRSRLGVYEPLVLEFDKETERYRAIGPLQTSQERLDDAVLKALADLDATSEERAKTSLEVTAKSGKRKQAVTDTLKILVTEGTRVASVYRGRAVVYWLKLIVHLTHEPVPGTDGTAEQLNSQNPPRGVLVPDPTVPENHLPEGEMGEQIEEQIEVPTLAHAGDPSGLRAGTRAAPEGPKKRERSPEQETKLVVERAERERVRLDAADASAPTLSYVAVLSDQELVEALRGLSVESVGLDTETTGLSAKTDRLRTINLSDGHKHVVIDAWSITDWALLQDYLDTVSSVRMHTYLFDLAFLQQVGLTIDPSKIVDVKTMSMVLESQEDWTDYRLQAIAKRHLAEHVDKTEQKRGWDQPTLRHAKLAYAAEDARVTFAAADAIEAKLRADPDVDGLSYCLALEQDVQAATWWLASAGVPCDVGVMHTAIADQRALIAARLAELNALVGTELNWRSPSQVLPILLERGLDIPSTGIDALMEAQSDDPIIDALLAYRSASTCAGLLERTLRAIAPDGRIYASFNPIGAQTGRTSCSEPNLQQLPHETQARASIRPGPGRVFVRADYSQLQIVIAAWISGDKNMQRILNSPGGDIHQATADAVGCSRQQAKAINFGFLFGAGPDTFRREQRKNGIVLTEDEAKRYRNTFMKTYPGIRQWHRSLGEWNTEAVVIDDTGSGRRRSRIFSNNVKANTPVQMAEAHGFKLAMQALYASRDEVPSARLVMMVHDELIAECDYDDRYLVAKWLKSHMVDAMQPLVDGVRVDVETTIVPSYADDDKH
jgi:DNA polymerase-1